LAPRQGLPVMQPADPRHLLVPAQEAGQPPLSYLPGGGGNLLDPPASAGGQHGIQSTGKYRQSGLQRAQP